MPKEGAPGGSSDECPFGEERGYPGLRQKELVSLGTDVGHFWGLGEAVGQNCRNPC